MRRRVARAAVGPCGNTSAVVDADAERGASALAVGRDGRRAVLGAAHVAAEREQRARLLAAHVHQQGGAHEHLLRVRARARARARVRGRGRGRVRGRVRLRFRVRVRVRVSG